MKFTIWILDMPDIVVRQERAFDIVLKSKIIVICARSNNKWISFSTKWKYIHDVCVYHRVDKYAQQKGCGQKVL